MKQILFFLCIIIAITLLPLREAQAAGKKTAIAAATSNDRGRLSSINARSKISKHKMKAANPHQGYHEGFLDHLYQIEPKNNSVARGGY